MSYHVCMCVAGDNIILIFCFANCLKIKKDRRPLYMVIDHNKLTMRLEELTRPLCI